MRTEQMPEEPRIELEGQLTMIPEESTDSRISLQKPISVPDIEQLELWQLSILMSDILMRFSGSLPESWLYDIFVGKGHITSFVYNDVLGGLLDNGAAEYCDTENGRAVVLTEDGMLDAKKSRLLVPKVFRDRLHLSALRYTARQNALRDLQIDYEEAENVCRVCLRCTDSGREMFYLRISAPTRTAAEELGECILRNPARFFGKIIDLAMTNEEEPFDLTDN